MFKRRRPDGRENLVASAALETLRTRAGGEAAMAALAALVPGWRAERHGAIRLINLERRARFARPFDLTSLRGAN